MRTPEEIADDLDEACVAAYFDKGSSMKERNKHYAPDSGCRACIIEGIRAAQAEALEEAARILDVRGFRDLGWVNHKVFAERVAEDIRRLKTNPPETKAERCEACGGNGKFHELPKDGRGLRGPYVNCPNCNGTGQRKGGG